jgi:hypothetical protein
MAKNHGIFCNCRRCNPSIAKDFASRPQHGLMCRCQHCRPTVAGSIRDYPKNIKNPKKYYSPRSF